MKIAKKRRRLQDTLSKTKRICRPLGTFLKVQERGLWSIPITPQSICAAPEKSETDPATQANGPCRRMAAFCKRFQIENEKSKNSDEPMDVMIL